MDCPECHRQAAVSIAPQVPKSKIDYSRLNTSRPSGIPGGGYKPPSSSAGGMTAGQKLFFGAAALFFFLLIVSQCSSKDKPVPSASVYTPAPAYTPPAPTYTPPVKRGGWASVYYSPVTKKYSWGIGYATEAEAKKAALESCNKQQGSCREWVTEQKKCFAIYQNMSTYKLHLSFGSNLLEAMDEAEKQCNKEPGYCRIDDSIGISNNLMCDDWP
jgi:hypothetical protein